MSTLKKTISIVATFVIVVFYGCTSSRENYGKDIISRASMVLGEKLSQFDNVVIIPGSGCTGCISQAEFFFKNNMDNENMLFIFTKYYSYKNMTLRLGGEDNLLRNNVYMDAENIFYLPQYNEHMYPYLIVLENNEVLTTRPL